MKFDQDVGPVTKNQVSGLWFLQESLELLKHRFGPSARGVQEQHEAAPAPISHRYISHPRANAFERAGLVKDAVRAVIRRR
jgi:hypothetical protein